MYVYIYIYIYILRGWRNTVGNRVEVVWLKQTCYGPHFAGTCMKHRGHGFGEFEISNSTVSAVFRLALVLQRDSMAISASAPSSAVVVVGML